ncbi:hypothetical protein GCM10010172_42580 [Paractinoplanes ferrugineus]|uniref:Uncharacterized protein n=1 Tax=Paractinoplanes ferrugineus TaxID=113564 RepID=A0A919JA56_9ACTN|nr:hypothetical protein [Actinoplanes ferrugineus]GIE13416.1 hypothetical protein Afe05nite_52560 [Actinoplanes ferrugineus]
MPVGPAGPDDFFWRGGAFGPERAPIGGIGHRFQPGHRIRLMVAGDAHPVAGGLAALIGGVMRRRHPTDRGETMPIQGIFYLLAVILLVLAALPIGTRGISLALLGAAFALLGYSWDTITG